jgi:hypothetical protein
MGRKKSEERSAEGRLEREKRKRRKGVSPEDLKKLLAYLEKHGSIVQHTTETEDKTSVVVDTEAKI